MQDQTPEQLAARVAALESALVELEQLAWNFHTAPRLPAWAVEENRALKRRIIHDAQQAYAKA